VSIRVAWRRRTAVLIGGGLGTGARFGVSLIISSAVLGTFIVNILGAGVLGYVLGAFTTFSGLAVQLVEGPPLQSLTYGVASLAAGILATVVGLTLGRQG
jgi:fluoride ion exporter CrcB/FEX